MTDIHSYNDIHTHDLNAGDSAIINLPWGAEVPDSGSYSVGIHPWDTENTTDADFELLGRLAANPRVVAIGECGIDALRGASVGHQLEIFRRHVAVSETVGKPLIIHAVRSLPAIMHERKVLHPAQKWIIHGYRGNATTARQLLALGIDISLGNRYNADVPSVVPPDRLYRESDSPAES